MSTPARPQADGQDRIPADPLAPHDVLRSPRAHRFVLCLGYKADVIEEFFLRYEEWISNDFTLSKRGKELTLENNDIENWTITFVDTGLHANIGERLVAVRKYVQDAEIFLANYSDGLTDLDINAMIREFRAGDKVASFLAVPPSQSFHRVDLDGDGQVASLHPRRRATTRPPHERSDKDAPAMGDKPRERRLDSRRGRVSYFTWDGPGGPGGVTCGRSQWRARCTHGDVRTNSQVLQI